MSDTVVRVENLSKRYFIGASKVTRSGLKSLVTDLGAPLRRAQRLLRGETTAAAGLHEEIWALKDVSFEVKRGEVLGIIGRNGAGKSTLLKILSRITEPTEGYAIVNGRVGALLEVGTGFHEELTGRENMYMNGSIMGMKKAEIDRQFDEIVTFAGVEKFIDTPVKHYSSGMKVRLAFATAAHLENEILVIDEVLSVGDAEFRKKSLNKMKTIIQEGRTVLFVSHNMSTLQQVCPNTILLENGQLIAQGASQEIIRYYLTQQLTDSHTYDWHWTEAERHTLAPFIPLSLRILDESGRAANRLDRRQPIYFEIEYDITRRIPNLRLGVTLSTDKNEAFGTLWEDIRGLNKEPGRHISRCEVPGGLLDRGSFVLGIISGIFGAQKLYRDYELLVFHVEDETSPVHSQPSILRPTLEWETCEL